MFYPLPRDTIIGEKVCGGGSDKLNRWCDAGVARGIEVEMEGGLQVSESPLAPLRGEANEFRG